MEGIDRDEVPSSYAVLSLTKMVVASNLLHFSSDHKLRTDRCFVSEHGEYCSEITGSWVGSAASVRPSI